MKSIAVMVVERKIDVLNTSYKRLSKAYRNKNILSDTRNIQREMRAISAKLTVLQEVLKEINKAYSAGSSSHA